MSNPIFSLSGKRVLLAGADGGVEIAVHGGWIAKGL
jgi:hypothetical protein